MFEGRASVHRVMSLRFLLGLVSIASAFARDDVQPILNTSSSVGHLGHPDGFVFPQVGQLGDEVLFHTDFGSSTSALLVYAANGGGLVDGVFNSSNYVAFGDASIATAEGPAPRLLAFVATAQEAGSGATDVLVLQATRSRTTQIIQIAKTGQSFKPAGSTFTEISAPMVALSEDGKNAYVVFLAQTATGWQGIILANVTLTTPALSSPTLSLVADSNTIIPGSSGSLRLLCLGSQAVSKRGDVVFFGSHCGSSSPGSSAVVRQRAARSMFRTRRKRDHSLARAGDVFPGIFRWSATAGLTVIADASTVVPAGAAGSAADKFVAFSDPGIGSDGTAAFVGETTSGNLGIFASTPGKHLEAVATTETLAPGSTDQYFGDFPYVPSVGRNGSVAFYASVSGPFSGVFSGTRPVADGGQGNWSLEVELNLDDGVAGQPIIFLGFGTNAYSDSGLLAAYLVLDNGVDGVYTFSSRGARGGGAAELLV